MDYKHKVIIDKVVRTFVPPLIGILPLFISNILKTNYIYYDSDVNPFIILLYSFIFQFLIIIPSTKSSVKIPLIISIVFSSMITAFVVWVASGAFTRSFNLLEIMGVFIIFEHYWLINFSVIALLNWIRNKTNFYTNWSWRSLEKVSNK